MSSLAENRQATSQAHCTVVYVFTSALFHPCRAFSATKPGFAMLVIALIALGAASLPGARVYPPAVAVPRTTPLRALRERWFIVDAGGGWLMARARFNASRASVTQKIELRIPRAPFFSSLLISSLRFSSLLPSCMLFFSLSLSLSRFCVSRSCESHIARDSNILPRFRGIRLCPTDARHTLLLPIFVQGRTTSFSTSNLQG